MKVLLLSRYSRLGASSRIRSYQYLPYLSAAGIDVDAAPFLDDDFLRERYLRGRVPLAKAASAYARRLVKLLSRRCYDLYWIEYEVLPWLPAWFERLLMRSRVPFAAGYDDAVFHNYDSHKLAVVRSMLGRKIDRIMARSSLVIAGNDYLAERAELAGACRVEVIPSVVDLDRYRIQPPEAKTHDTCFRIGWIGSPTSARYLRLVEPALRQACSRTGASVVLVGAGDLHLDGVPLELRPWSESGEVEEILSFDVGIMPLEHDNWSRGKCGYKLIQYMACSLPVIASPIGVNRRIVEPGHNGILASSEDEWIDAIVGLKDNSELRTVLGRNGRRKVETGYSLQSTAPRMAELFLETAGR